MDRIVNISLTNLPTAINSLNRSFDDCNDQFENISDSVRLLKRSLRDKKSEINTELDDYNESLLDNLDQMHKLISVGNDHNEKFNVKLTEYNSVLIKYKTNQDVLIKSVESLKEKIVKSVELITNKVSGDSTKNHLNKSNPFILQSRQTKHPFIITVMKHGIKSSCGGCKNKFLHDTNYLQHLEEYPAGSKIFRPQGYHINRDCVFRRGFEINYIKETRVTSDEVAIDQSLFESLKEIGFETENIDMTTENLKLSESLESVDKDFSDSQSNTSTTPSVASVESSNLAFKYFWKPPHITNLICDGCSLIINEWAYLVYGNNNLTRPTQYHIRKSCLQKGGFIANISSERCFVGKSLKTHDEVKQLLSCGFHYKNIIGFKPKNPNKSLPSKTPVNQSARDAEFLFNDQPFTYQKLEYREKCRGCIMPIFKNEIALCHKEKESRSNLENLPFISQWYHVSIECLRARGFSNRYLSSSKCYYENIDDQFAHLENLIKCGFRQTNIYQILPQIQAEPQTPEICNEKKLFVKISADSLARCEGCSFRLTPGQPCFIYSFTPTQNSNSRMFHIRRSCLENRFNKEEIQGMSCINLENVSPKEIINCGVSVFTSMINISVEKTSQKPKSKPLTCKVYIIDNAKSICGACKMRIPLDTYALKMTTHERRSSLIHLNSQCVEIFAISPRHVSNCIVSSVVYLSSDIIEELKKCGFRKFPRS